MMDLLGDALDVTRPQLILATAAGIAILYWLWHIAASKPGSTTFQEHQESLPRSRLASELAESLPGCVFFPVDAAYSSSKNSYWSKQNREIQPECIIRPRTEKEVSETVRIIKEEYDQCILDGTTLPTFAIRSGGHSTVPGASNSSRGIVLDLSLFKDVDIATDQKSVVVGSGARWGDVSRKLDDVGLAVVGGRNSDVGVGGLTLGGGYSYFSPQHGFVCDNVLEYRVVLASGTIVAASETENADLWRALKGGANNFCIVVSFRLRAFPCTKVWSGFIYMWSWKASQMLNAFQKFVADCKDLSAGGPLFCISYVQQIGLTIIATHLIYTKPEPWPQCWQEFKKVGRIWSSTKARTLTSTTDELDGISPAGFRQLHISTTIQNDLLTLEFAHDVFKQKAKLLKKVKGLVWTLVLQPLHTSTMRHGKYNVFGLGDRPESLVVVLFTAVWENSEDDDLVNGSGRDSIDQINRYAVERGTADCFRYLNWCDGTQRPFESYGEDSLRFLRTVRKQVDPDGLFQRGCVGGHKLGEGV